MAVKQLSVLAANKKGSLKEILNVIANAGIDLRSISVADSERYGIFRMIVNDPDGAVKALSEAGFTSRTNEVVAVAIPDEPGSLLHLLTVLENADINLEYMYSVINSEAGSAFMVLRVDDNVWTEEVLKKEGVELLTGEKLCQS
ncbi:MAG: ACT domain-containing protein [Lachnospiraceae bacterium]|nr:ACT domain-containing protein [Lachnospiraceae bacterium]MBR5739338.1 ACT domain-containing protein [Lachnospiraceae bacterium]